MSNAPQALESYLSGAWRRGEGVETELVDPVRGDVLATASARGLDLKAALDHARRTGGPALRGLSFAERAKLIGAVADVLIANRAKYEDDRGGEFRQYQDRCRDRYRRRHRHPEILCAAWQRTWRRHLPARREACAARQGGEFPGDPSAGATSRRGRAYQCVQLSELGSVGEGCGIAARRRAGPGKACVVNRIAHI